MAGKTKIAEIMSKFFAKAGTKMGVVVGAGTFFGLEWFTNGGLVNSVAGATGMPTWLASLLLSVFVFAVAIILLITIYNRLTKSKTISRSTSRSTKRGG